MKAKIYVAGPYTEGDVDVNIRNACAAASELGDLGFAPLVPHLTHYWNTMFPRPDDFWLDLDSQFLPCCDAVFRLPGVSESSDKETTLARQLGLPVFDNIQTLLNYFDEFNIEDDGE
jgi:hypothetical protein